MAMGVLRDRTGAFELSLLLGSVILYVAMSSALLLGCKKTAEPTTEAPPGTAAPPSQTRAETGQGNQSPSEEPQTEIKRLKDFLRKHPSIAADFESDPSLETDADYEDEHPDWKSFLSQQTELREYLREHPIRPSP
jgi:hypothetical protein